MHLLTPLYQYFTTLTRGDYYGLLSFIGASGGVAVLLQALKPHIRKLEARYGMDAKKLIIAFLGLMAFTLSVANDVLSANPQSLQVLGSHAAEIVGLATLLYHFGVSPAHAKLVNFLQDANKYIDTGELPGISNTTSATITHATLTNPTLTSSTYTISTPVYYSVSASNSIKKTLPKP